jgi:hypothetical protein
LLTYYLQAVWDSFIEGASFEDTYQGMPFIENALSGYEPP